MRGFGQLVQERGELVEPRRDGLGAWAARVSAAHGGVRLVRLGLVVGRSDLKGVAVSMPRSLRCAIRFAVTTVNALETCFGKRSWRSSGLSPVLLCGVRSD